VPSQNPEKGGEGAERGGQKNKNNKKNKKRAPENGNGVGAGEDAAEAEEEEEEEKGEEEEEEVAARAANDRFVLNSLVLLVQKYRYRRILTLLALEAAGQGEPPFLAPRFLAPKSANLL
jgi:hypothetical protein